MPLDEGALLAFQEDLKRELNGQSDRGLVVLAAAGIDYLLENLLDDYLHPDLNRKNVLRGSGALSTFSARIEMAFGMGLISADERQDLNTIRGIRNTMAHEMLRASFATQSIRDKCRNLVLGERLYVPEVIPMIELAPGKMGIPYDPESVTDLPTVDLQLPESDDPRARFHATTIALVRVVVSRTLTSPRRPASPDEFESPEEPMDAVVDRVDKLQDELQRLRDSLDLEEESGEPEEGLGSGGDLDAALLLIRYSHEVLRRSRRRNL